MQIKSPLEVLDYPISTRRRAYILACIAVFFGAVVAVLLLLHPTAVYEENNRLALVIEQACAIQTGTDIPTKAVPDEERFRWFENCITLISTDNGDFQ